MKLKKLYSGILLSALVLILTSFVFLPQSETVYLSGELFTPQGEYYFAQNTDIYETIYLKLLNSASEINVSNYNMAIEEVQSIYYSVLYENPELFYVKSRLSYSMPIGQNKVLSIAPEYSISGNALANAKAAYENELAAIVDGVNPSWSNLEKVVYINDFFAANYSYDNSLSIFDAYTFFTEKTGVCQAYSAAFIAVMNRLNIPVSYVISEPMNHMWNLVMLEGKWYHIDVTWNDPITDMPGRAMHTNLLRSDIGIQSTGHYGWTGDILCTSTKYDNYFWQDSKAPIVFSGGNWYYLNKSDFTIYKHSLSSGTGTAIYTIDSRWPVFGSGRSNWTECLSGLGAYNNLLIFNTYDGIFALDPATGASYAIYRPSISNGHIQYFTINGSTLTYYLYNYTGSITPPVSRGNFDLSSIGAKHTLTYMADGQIYATQLYSQGETISLPPAPQRIGFVFSSWSPSLPAIMPGRDLVVTANFETASCQHNTIKEVTVEATCTESGRNTTTCSDCGTLLSAVVIPAKGHRFSPWTQSKEAGCTETGIRSRSCTVCGSIDTETIPPKGHSYGDWVITLKPTDAKEGTRQKTCSICGDIISEILPPLPSNDIDRDTGSTPVTTTGDPREGDNSDTNESGDKNDTNNTNNSDANDTNTKETTNDSDTKDRNTTDNIHGHSEEQGGVSTEDHPTQVGSPSPSEGNTRNNGLIIIGIILAIILIISIIIIVLFVPDKGAKNN